jgi:HAD superfamily hydrolase (TIGR01509 family)
MRSHPTRTVVFDLDGTLVDSLTLVLAAIRHAIEPFGGRTSQDIFGHLGGPPESFMATLVPDRAQVPEAVRRMARYHREHGHLIRPYAGTHRVLEELRRRGVQVAIWTGRDRASTDGLLATHRLGEHLACVVCGDDLPSHKPDPAGLREILARLGAAAAETLLVGDADVDVLGGHACGVDTILIRHERAIGGDILAKAWRTADTPEDAYTLVRQVVGAGA